MSGGEKLTYNIVEIYSPKHQVMNPQTQTLTKKKTPMICGPWVNIMKSKPNKLRASMLLHQKSPNLPKDIVIAMAIYVSSRGFM